MTTSAVNPLNSVPLVNSTQILTSQVPGVTQAPVTSVVAPTQMVASTPIISQAPIAASTPIITQAPIAASTPIVSQVPMVAATNLQNSHFTNQAFPTTLVDLDYRMGRGIFDEFRPNVQTSSVVATTGVPVATTQVVTAPVVSTPLVSTPAVVPTGGANALKDFL